MIQVSSSKTNRQKDKKALISTRFCHVEIFQIYSHDICGEFCNYPTYVKEFQIFQKTEVICNLRCFVTNLFCRESVLSRFTFFCVEKF